MFAFLDCASYNDDFIKSRFVIPNFCSIHFIVSLARWKKSFVIQRTLLYRSRFIKSRFHCTLKVTP